LGWHGLLKRILQYTESQSGRPWLEGCANIQAELIHTPERYPLGLIHNRGPADFLLFLCKKQYASS